ncbi:hypothetical protein CAOG_02683 [Capsaspora owczarzaki ATCC 30864]|uniref:EF-hand domain-containing protein n=1 Tax=Capsaspora owczarzaki (strain ATCC 30864) TaxID=595528 RepID=A0A0D2WLR2_CAPO3|nr:hypothetical protein CAOG_02683 [Capsaspora owczarzaki ATCC 30864]KJE91555.1 hypothetical protein CAOG_002683 [Capsaspora owczarzaki ATCC 30864]|eukprot:XP_004349433.2 hypothetical protein CAOG_02683 [Capsaspora owczarzaki ATCC 30864]
MTTTSDKSNKTDAAASSVPSDEAAALILAAQKHIKPDDVKALLAPLAQQLSMGTVSGFAAGYAAKKVGKAVAMVLAMGFVGLQAAQYAGYIHVNWGKIEKDVKSVLDVNRDGKVDEADIKHLYEHAMEVARYALPSSTGFATGLALGLKFA